MAISQCQQQLIEYGILSQIVMISLSRHFSLIPQRSTIIFLFKFINRKNLGLCLTPIDEQFDTGDETTVI